MGGGIRAPTRVNSQKIKSENRNVRSYSGGQALILEKPKKRVFISFHVDDESMIQLMRHQAKSDKFDIEFTDYSVKEPFDSQWRAKVRERIMRSSVVFVPFGEETHRREAVLWEVNTAYAMGKKVVAIRLQKNHDHQVPRPIVLNKSPVINWNMEDMQNELDKESN